jgi:predicted DNA-binding transcriptional regulator AlpA
MTRETPLPPGTLPRGFRRPEAAAYVGLGETKFDELVKDGRMPRPKRIDGRVVFDRRALDAAFDALGEDAQADCSAVAPEMPEDT